MDTLFTKHQIEVKVGELAEMITSHYVPFPEEIVSNGSPIALCILDGSFMFFSDLMKKIGFDPIVAFMKVSSYKDNVRQELSNYGFLSNWNEESLSGRDLLIVEDIIDTGITMANVLSYMLRYKFKSIKICTLLDKPGKRLVPIAADWVGFKVEKNHFVSGYGLDHCGSRRTSPYIEYFVEG